jgi:hypothetical protein
VVEKEFLEMLWVERNEHANSLSGVGPVWDTRVLKLPERLMQSISKYMKSGGESEILLALVRDAIFARQLALESQSRTRPSELNRF